MATDDASLPETLRDDEITTRKKVSRRSLLASTGIAFAAGAATMAAAVGTSRASDKKEGDMRDRQNPDPRRLDSD